LSVVNVKRCLVTVQRIVCWRCCYRFKLRRWTMFWRRWTWSTASSLFISGAATDH